MEKKSKKSLSCREAVTRDLRIFVSAGTVNEREKIRRSRITNFRDDRPLCYNNKAFTLIELLVVVLIIGILAAIAVPQYQKAVDKSRMVQLLVINKAVREAEERYYLANGNYTRDWDVLEIGFAGQKGSGAAAYQWYFPGSKIQIYLGPSVSDNSVWSWDTRLEDVELRSVYIYGGQGTTRDGRTFCYAARTNARAKQACLSISSSCEVLDANKYICYVK